MNTPSTLISGFEKAQLPASANIGYTASILHPLSFDIHDHPLPHDLMINDPDNTESLRMNQPTQTNRLYVQSPTTSLLTPSLPTRRSEKTDDLTLNEQPIVSFDCLSSENETHTLSPIPLRQITKVIDANLMDCNWPAIYNNRQLPKSSPYKQSHSFSPSSPASQIKTAHIESCAQIHPDSSPLPDPITASTTGSGKTIDTESIYHLDAIFNIPVRNFSSLNRSDVAELERHSHLIALGQNSLLKSVQRKRELHPQRYRDDYLRHSSILLLTPGWSSAQRYSLCSVPNQRSRAGICRLHKFCPYCAFLEGGDALCRYVPVFESGIWHFLTGSFSGQLTMTTNGDYYDLLHYWDAYKIALWTLVKEKLVRGVFWTEELAVNSIAPTQVLPHIHATIEADEIGADVWLRLNELVKEHLSSSLGPDTLNPDIKVKNLNSQRKLLSHIKYQIKPIKLVKAYDLAWSRALHNNRAGAVRLNSQTTDLVLGYSAITNRRQKINYAGNLNPKAKLFIGVKAKDMKSAGKVVKDVMRDGADYIETDKPDAKEFTTAE